MDAKLKRTQMMKDGPIRSTLITLAIPSIIAMLVTAMYNFIDTLFVGMLHDTNAMAGVSIGFPLFIMITAMGMLVGIGASSYAGRKLGSNEKEMADRTAGLAMVMGV
ncbi:MAG: MATE family efflux transporter, partial [Erysipelotrichaceae bacterium]